jgi:hypothetical protein
MLLGKSTKGLLLLSSLLVTSAAYAAPTVSNYSNNLLAPSLSANADARVLGFETKQTSELYNTSMATVAAELLKPPAIANLPTSPIDSIGVSAKPLPPLPAAIFLGLTGFLCVSLVKDRKVWLAAFAGLLWLTHAGFTTLPKFASHILSKKQIQHFAAGGTSLIYVSQLDGSFRPRSELQGSQYIGLLRHLAGIPDTIMSLPLTVPSLSLRAKPAFSPERSRRGSNLTSLPNRFESAQSKYKSRLPQFAINLSIPHSILSDNCLASGAEQILPYLPAFTSMRLARGPPQK